MTEILRLESPNELLRSRREYTIREISVYREREKNYLAMAFEAKQAREELERSLLRLDLGIEKLEGDY